MNRLYDLLTFLLAAAGLWFVVGFLTLGYSCFRHGDVGPYPEMDWASQWLLPCCLAAAAAWVILRRGAGR